MNRPSSTQIRRTAELTTRNRFTAGQVTHFLAEGEIPADAEVTIHTVTGDPGDPREAGYRQTTIKAAWNEECPS